MVKITVNNNKPRIDTDGLIVDCHESHIEQFGDRIYLYGMAYANRTGWTDQNRMACYSTRDFMTWTNHGPLSGPVGIAIPCVKFNPKTGKYVMWYVHDKQYFTMMADAPEGPFSDPRPAHTKGPRSGDFSLFLDTDGLGYIIYTACFGDRNYPLGMHLILIEKLSDDLRNGVGKVCGPLAWNCESPVMFRRDETYYALFDNTCCWNPAGTGCRIYTAHNPLGPYTYRGDINRNVSADPREIVSENSDTVPGAGRDDVIISMQVRDAVEIQTPGGPEIILSGDRWGSNEDGWKGHDFVYVTSPLQFDDDSMVRPLQWQDTWSLDISVNFA